MITVTTEATVAAADGRGSDHPDIAVSKSSNSKGVDAE